MTENAVAALRHANDPPTLFARGGHLVQIRLSDHVPRVDVVSESALRGRLSKVADWYMETRSGPRGVAPPLDVVKDILSGPERNAFPTLNRVVETPCFAEDGSLIATPGYHATARVWFHRPRGVTFRPPRKRVTSAVVAEARRLLVEELLGDFPFESPASLAHAVAAMLLPFAREMIAGGTPLHLFDAPTPGTGKTLLADLLGIPATGRSTPAMPPGNDDDEWRKRITATLIQGPAFVLIDNIKRRLDSAALAAALTAPTWEDRILGRSEMAHVPNRMVWMATGNNVALSNEIARRTVLSRLEANGERPWERKEFRHSPLRDWALAHRQHLVQACLTLIQAWLVEDRPAGETTLGSYESWAATIGGILAVAGITGFLGNRELLHGRADEEGRDWQAFVVAWWGHYQGDTVGIEQLVKAIPVDHAFSEWLHEGERSGHTRLGRAVSGKRGSIIAGYRIVDMDEDHRGRRQYRLEPA
jgi:hypothetical protein